MKIRVNLILTAACAALAAICLAAGAHAWLQGVARVLANTAAIVAFGVEAQPALAASATVVQTDDAVLTAADSETLVQERDDAAPDRLTPPGARTTGSRSQAADAVRTTRAPPGP